VYIVIEGIDGCGKSSVIAALALRLTQMNITPICIHEPTYGQYGLAARKLFEGDVMPSPSELHSLFTRDREEHVQTKINPVLKLIQMNPKFSLLQDSGYLSAPAYQVENDRDIYKVLEEQQAIAPQPDCFFLIDIEVPLALKRLKSRADGTSVFDRKKTLEIARKRYLMLAKNGSAPVKVLDGTLPIQGIVDRIIESVDLG